MSGVDTAAPKAVPAPVQAFLTQFAMALHKTRAYPPGHPMRQGAVAATHQMLAAARPPGLPLYIGVARRQLMVDGAGTDPSHYVLRDLASRLSRLQVGAVVIGADATEADLAHAIDALAGDPTSEPPTGRPRIWGGVGLLPVAYEALKLDAGGPEDHGGDAEALWRDLAWRALAGGGVGNGTGWGDGSRRADTQGPGPGGGDGLGWAGGGSAGPLGWAGQGTPAGVGTGPGPSVDEILVSGSEAFAEALAERLQRPETRAAVAKAVEQVARHAASLDPEARRTIEVKLRHLLASLPREALGLLLNVDFARREDLARVEPAVEWLPVPALLEVLDMAGRAQQQDISTSLLRMLRKLAANADAANADPANADPAAENDLRAVLREILHAWTLESPNPWHHTHVLESLARRERSPLAIERTDGEGLRLVQIALETEATGEQLEEGVELAIEAGDLAPMVRALDTAPAESAAARVIWGALTAPAMLRRLLLDRNSEPAALERVLSEAGEAALEALLDGVIRSQDRSVQRVALQRVIALGPRGVSALASRLGSVSPAGLRPVLAILAELPDLPDGLTVRTYTESPDPLTRLEAYRVMTRNPGERDEAIHGALADPDERVVRVAVEAGAAGFPRSSLTRLLLLLNSAGRSVELRARGVSLLAQFDAPVVRQWLLEGLVVRRGWLRRLRLVPKTPVLVAKLTVLADRWGSVPEVQRVLRLARATGDADLIAACGEGESG